MATASSSAGLGAVEGGASKMPVPLDREMQSLLDGSSGFTHLSVDELAAARAALPASWGRPPAGTERSEVRIETPGGRQVVLHVNMPATRSEPLPCLIWLHGGGYVMGSCASGAGDLERWTASMGWITVAVDYRLAPEQPFPAALEDAYSALDWVAATHEALPVDAGRIGLVGTSAGGGLAAGLALLARDRGEVQLRLQCLQYPMLDDRFETRSSRWAQIPVWSSEANAFAWQCYLGGTAATTVSEYAAPARSSDLTGLPPTFLLVGTADGFLDEVTTYALELTHAGVETDLRIYGGAPHGFLALAPQSEIARRARRDADEWLLARLSEVPTISAGPGSGEPS